MKLEVGQRVEFIRNGHPFGPVIHGYVISLTGDDSAPAKLRNNGRVYVPRSEDYVTPPPVQPSARKRNDGSGGACMPGLGGKCVVCGTGDCHRTDG